MEKAHLLIAAVVLIALIIGALVVFAVLGYNPKGGSHTPIDSSPPDPTATPSSTAMPSSTPTTLPSFTPSPTSSSDVLVYTYSVINTFPHDSNAFTQGLIVEDDDVLLEGTGNYGASSLRRVGLRNGTVLQQYNLSGDYFGEGIAVVGDRLIQLTWQNHVGFVYNLSSFELLSQFNLSTEGWGLTYNGTHLILSDGSSRLYFLDPDTFEAVGSVIVHDGASQITTLNELEYVNGDVYANIWQSQKIAIINPQTGKVKAYIDLTGLYQASDPNAVLNGIAYNEKTNQLYVTGKCWPNLYEIQLVLKN
jgi:glutamine cyclotransferase